MKKLSLKRKSIVILATIVGLLIGTYYSTEALFSGLISSIPISEAPLPGFAFVVNEEVWFVLEDPQEMQYVIETYQAPMVARINDPAAITSIEFVDNVAVTEIMHTGQFYNAQQALARLNQNKDEAVLYTVQQGDTLWDIAYKYEGISFSDLAKFNSNIDLDRIWPGNVIVLQPSRPSLDVIITKVQVVEESIPYTNEIIRDNNLVSGARVVVKRGTEGSKNVTYAIKTLNGFPSSVEITNETILSEPIGGVVRVGTQRTLRRTTTNNFGITVGRFTSGFGYRIHPVTGRREFHFGIDIAGPQGTAVNAYANGTVTRAQFLGGFGNVIEINHGGGLRTLYAHLSRISVRVGDQVTVGQQIGSMGSTGVSTGSHLHFEVIRNGSRVNPIGYLN